MMPLRLPRKPITLLTLGIIPTSIALYSTMTSKPPISSSNSTTSPNAPLTISNDQPFPIRTYKPHHPSFPYTSRDFLRQDTTDDTDFYSTPRFVTHIDDNAIALLKTYYAASLPHKGRILDLCSSWISHFPLELEERARAGKEQQRRQDIGEEAETGGGLEVIGLGMNKNELSANPILASSILQNLNINPTLPHPLAPLDATTCVVSIDYLTQPLTILSSLLERTKEGGSIHLIISNRCFPTKAIGRWLRISEEERLQMVGDYLWFSGWKGVEIVEVSDGRGVAGGFRGMFGGGVDPLWVVRAVKAPTEEGEGRSE